jgi:hypothetical protein
MDEATKERIKHEIEDRAKTLFPVRRVEWLQYGDQPMIEPGELLPQFVLTEPPGRRRGRPAPRETLKAFQNAHGPALKQFQHELSQRWPEVRHIGVHFEDDSGHARGGMIQELNDDRGDTESDITHVMARLKTAELDIVDTLINAGIANSRAEAIRWALTRISERPAYAQLRKHTLDIERLKTEF